MTETADTPRGTRPPLAVVVSGAPGSGKSTLADMLAVHLDIPSVNNDRLVHGHWRTLDRALELGAPSVEPFYRTMELWLESRISFVADRTFYRRVSEPDIERRLAPRSVLVNVHCRSVHAIERFTLRMEADPLCGEARLRKLLPLVETLQRDLWEPLGLACPIIVVDTTEGYEPSVEAIVSTIDGLYSRPLVHDLDR